MSEQDQAIEPVELEDGPLTEESVYQQVEVTNGNKTALLWLNPEGAVLGLQLTLPGYKGKWHITEVMPFVLNSEQLIRMVSDEPALETMQ